MKVKSLFVLALLIPMSLALNQTGVCHNDYVCTLDEYKAHCPDCVVHNVTYPNSTQPATQISGPVIPNWVILAVLAILVLGIIVAIGIVVVYVLWKKRGKL